jgi:hypothetical protein
MTQKKLKLNKPDNTNDEVELPVRKKLSLSRKRPEVKENVNSTTKAQKNTHTPPAPYKKTAKKTAKQKTPQPKQFEIDEVLTGVDRLCTSFPKLFNLSDPKPLKIGIDKDILAEHDWDGELLVASMRYYTKQEKYNYNTVHVKCRYDLQGHEDQELTASEKAHAIIRINNGIGRFEAERKYPEIKQRLKQGPEPVEEKTYAYLYYYPTAKQELYKIIQECYGRDFKTRKPTEELGEDKFQCSMTIEIKNYDLELSVKSVIAENRRLAVINCQKRLLVRLQNTIQAYPFPYKKPKVAENEIA